MGGLVCQIHKNAVIRFTSVPTGPVQLAAFDKQMREFYNSDYIAERTAEDNFGPEVCAILIKSELTHEDRERLLYIADELSEY